jgi:hypothetical protein
MKKRAVGVGALVVVGAGLLGLGAGIAFAAGPALFAPTGVTADEGIVTTPMPEPSYATNESGLTYGSAADASSPDTEPDLIQAVAMDGQQGYVRKSDLDDANGTTAAKSFETPEDALAWQESEGAKDHVIPVYESDGVTQIGVFLVVGGDTQSQIAASFDSEQSHR